MRRDHAPRTTGSRRVVAVLLAIVAVSAARVGASRGGFDYLCAAPKGHDPLSGYGCGHLPEHCLRDGIIKIMIAPGADVAALVVDHGGKPSDAVQSLEGPFDRTARQVGLDRFYEVQVPTGVERVKAREYRFDARVEYADIDSHNQPPCGERPLGVQKRSG